MNIRKIITFNNLRRQFTPDELAFADTLYHASEADKQMIVEALQPAKVVKRTRKQAAKSPRASNMAAALKGRVGRQPAPKCTFIVNDVINEQCGAVEDDEIHDTAYATSHHFIMGPATRPPICATCGNVEDYVDHSEPSPSYHPFTTSIASASHAASGGE